MAAGPAVAVVIRTLDEAALRGSTCGQGHYVALLFPHTVKLSDGQWYCAQCFAEHEALVLARRRWS